MRTILITGASGGIGRALAERLADKETTLILHGRNITKLERTCAIAKVKEPKIIAFPANFLHLKELDKFIARAKKETINVLINNAAVALVDPLEKITLDGWNNALHLNVTVPFYLTQNLLSSIPAGGIIVNILSVAAKQGFPGWSSYCAGKFALEGFSRCIREELRDKNIRIVNIYPAAIDTDIWENIEGDWNREGMMKASDVAETVAFAISQPDYLAVESIDLNNAGGNL